MEKVETGQMARVEMAFGADEITNSVSMLIGREARNAHQATDGLTRTLASRAASW